MSEALRSEILKLVNDGDSEKGKALTSTVLLRIMRVAQTGRQVLVSLEASPSNLSGMVRKKRRFPVYQGSFDGEVGDTDDTSEGDALPAFANPLAPASATENFGMTAIREVIAAMKGMNGGTSPSKLVEALAIAREKGLDDVARDLEVQLGMNKATPAIPAADAGEKKEPKP